MKRLLVLCACLAVVAVVPVEPAKASIEPDDAAICSTSPKTPSQAISIVYDLKGPEALRYIAAREASDATFKETRAKAAEMLRARGLDPTNIARVMRVRIEKEPVTLSSTRIFKQLLNAFVPTVAAEEFDGYDVIAESWDDYDDSTWEGNFYVEELSTGQWASINEQKQLGAEPYQVNWSQQVNTNQKGTPGCFKTGSPCGYCNQAGAVGCNLGRAINDRWPYCVGGAAPCAFTGALWLVCAGGNCYGHLFGGFLWQSKNHFQQCWQDWDHYWTCTVK